MSDQADLWRNALFSISSGALTQSDKDRLAKVSASWVLLNTRLGRFFIDIIGPIPQLQAIQDELTAMGRAPILIGLFDRSGTLLNVPNKTEWAKVANDIVTYNPDGTVLSTTRPAAFVDTHRWSGWSLKIVP